MKRIARIFGWVLTVAGLVYCVSFATQVFHADGPGALYGRWSWHSMALAALAYFLIIPLSAWAWRRLLLSVQVDQSTLALNWIMGTTQLAKYLPGNVSQHIGRYVFSLRSGIPTGAFVITVAAEMLLAVASSAVIGAVALLSFLSTRHVPLGDRRQLLLLAALLFCGCLGALLAASRYAPAVAAKLYPTQLGQIIKAPRIDALLAAFGAYSLNYLIVGAGLFAVAAAAGERSVDSVSLCIAVFALSWMIGFLAPGAPAGLGVREGAMLVMFGPFMEKDVALATVVAFRLATVGGDLLAACWGVAAKEALSRQGASGPQ